MIKKMITVKRWYQVYTIR